MKDKGDNLYAQRHLDNNEFDFINNIEVNLREMCHASNGVLAEICSWVSHFNKKDELDEAENLFKTLCLYNIENADFVRGFAIVKHLKKDYQCAYDLYRISFKSNKAENCIVFFLMAQCQLCLNNKEIAMSCLQHIINNSNNILYKERAKKYLILLGS